MIFAFNSLNKHYGGEEGAANEILNKKIVTTFLYNFIDSRMKTEKMVMTVGKEVENFLNNLEKPMQLNEMRVMKEHNYVSIQVIINLTFF